MGIAITPLMSGDNIDMEMRTLTIEDYDDIIDVWQKAGLHLKMAGRDSRAEIKRQMDMDPGLFVGAFAMDGGRMRLVGVVLGSYDGRKGYINRLAVHPDFQRQGIATALVREMERIFDSRGILVITLLIEDHSRESRLLFRKLGYHLHDDITYWSKRVSDDV